MEEEAVAFNPTDYIIPILYTIICIIGVIGNLIVIYVILSISSLNPTNSYNLSSSCRVPKKGNNNNMTT